MNGMLARRFTIIGLTMAIFAVTFAAGVREHNRVKNGYASGHFYACVTGKEPICNISQIEELAK